MDTKYIVSQPHQSRGCCGVRRDQSGRRRCCCCPFWCGCLFFTILSALIITIIVLAIIIATAKRPDISIDGITYLNGATSPTIRQSDANSISADMALKVHINNPNVMGFTLETINGQGQSPLLPGVNIANGTLSNVDIPAHSDQIIDFPFTITFSTKTDPNGVILQDLVTKCGFTNQAKKPISINYSVQAKVRILIVNINVPYDGSTTYDCPISSASQFPLITSTVSKLLGAL